MRQLSRGLASIARALPAYLAAVGAAVALAAPAAAQKFNPTSFTLDNGLQVVVVENHRAPAVTQMIYYKAGSADEVAGKGGLAHFLEHLMFKGTPKHPPGEFSQLVAKHGGRENAFTTQDTTGYWQRVAADRLPMVMEMEADRMVNLVLAEDTVLSERDVILEERRQRVEQEAGGVLSEQLNAVTWLSHPYRNPVIGWEHEIRGLTRENALEFYRRWYAPNNAVLVIAGDVTAGDVRKLAEATYGQVPARPVPTRMRVTEPEQRAARRVELKDARVRQPSLSRRYIAPSYVAGAKELAPALEVASEVLGGGSTGRVFRALVVEQKVATSAGAFYAPSSIDLALFGLSVTPRAGVTPIEAEAALDALLNDLVARGVTADEVERAKQRMIDSSIFAMDNTQTVARMFASSLSLGQTAAEIEDWPVRIGTVTVEQVNAALKAVLRTPWSTTGVLLPADKG